MLESYYGLSFNPFDKHLLREKDAFASCDHREMTTRLHYLKEVRGVGVFTARPGMGKTYGLRCFVSSLNPNQYQTAYLKLSTLSITEFYRQFCELLGVDTVGGKTGMFRSIQERVYYLYKEKRQPLILAIDEAQYLNYNILRDLKMILNHGYDSCNCFTLILVGEPYLNNILEKPVHEALKQRVVVHYNYAGLSDQEISDYIMHKLETAGGSMMLLGDGALSAVHGYSQGNPRLIDNVMKDALTLGAQLEKKILDAEILLAAINNQSLA